MVLNSLPSLGASDHVVECDQCKKTKRRTAHTRNRTSTERFVNACSAVKLYGLCSYLH